MLIRKYYLWGKSLGHAGDVFKYGDNEEEKHVEEVKNTQRKN
jgi:hypothetical protein